MSRAAHSIWLGPGALRASSSVAVIPMLLLFAGKASPYPVVTECGVSVPGSEACVPRCWPGACLFFAVESARSWEVERGKNGADSGLAAPRRRAKSRAIRMIIAEYLCV